MITPYPYHLSKTNTHISPKNKVNNPRLPSTKNTKIPINNPGLPEPLNVKILVNMDYKNGYSKDYETIIESLCQHNYQRTTENNWKGLLITSRDFIKTITKPQPPTDTSMCDTDPYVSDTEDNKTEDNNL